MTCWKENENVGNSRVRKFTGGLCSQPVLSRIFTSACVCVSYPIVPVCVLTHPSLRSVCCYISFTNASLPLVSLK